MLSPTPGDPRQKGRFRGHGHHGDGAPAADGRRHDRGSVTAEFAAVVPAVVLLLALCFAAVHLGSLQVRVQDAAAVAARIAARGEAPSAAGVVTRMLPGASVTTSVAGDLVCVSVRAGAGAGPFAALRLAGSSCAPRSIP